MALFTALIAAMLTLSAIGNGFSKMLGNMVVRSSGQLLMAYLLVEK
jgi:hypothetical protein